MPNIQLTIQKSGADLQGLLVPLYDQGWHFTKHPVGAVEMTFFLEDLRNNRTIEGVIENAIHKIVNYGCTVFTVVINKKDA